MPRTLIFIPFYIVVLAWSQAACTSTPAGPSLVVDQNAELKNSKGDSEKLLPGQAKELSSLPAAVLAPGYAPVYLIAVEDNTEQIKLSLAPLKDAAADADPLKSAKSALIEALEQINQAQVQISAGRAKEAVTILENLRSRVPGSTYIDLLLASALVMAGDQQRAIRVLEDVVKAKPEHQPSQDFLKKLKGGG